MIKISNICLHQTSIFIKFFKILKIHKIFCENPRIIFVLFYGVHKENMFTINLEDGREAPSKASFLQYFTKKIIKRNLTRCVSIGSWFHASSHVNHPLHWYWKNSYYFIESQKYTEIKTIHNIFAISSSFYFQFIFVFSIIWMEWILMMRNFAIMPLKNVYLEQNIVFVYLRKVEIA